MTEYSMGVDVLDELTDQHSIVPASKNRDQRAASARDLASLSVDELWAFHQELEAMLTAKIAAELRQLERRIEQLNGVDKAGDGPSRRPYPPVLPKYRNPEAPFNTWSGRGRRPRWVKAQLELGRVLGDFTA
jgi:DNA-binding protein H-NS